MNIANLFNNIPKKYLLILLLISVTPTKLFSQELYEYSKAEIAKYSITGEYITLAIYTGKDEKTSDYTLHRKYEMQLANFSINSRAFIKKSPSYQETKIQVYIAGKPFLGLLNAKGFDDNLDKIVGAGTDAWKDYYTESVSVYELGDAILEMTQKMKVRAMEIRAREASLDGKQMGLIIFKGPKETMTDEEFIEYYEKNFLKLGANSKVFMFPSDKSYSKFTLFIKGKMIAKEMVPSSFKANLKDFVEQQKKVQQ